jgi:hypothetical protein
VFDVSDPVCTPSPASHVSSPTTPSSVAGSEDIPYILESNPPLVFADFLHKKVSSRF